MKKIKRVLVPVQFNRAGEDLLRYAGQLAGTLGAELLLIQNSNTTGITFTQQSRYISALRSFGDRILSQLKQKQTSVAFECVIRPGKLSESITSVVQDYHVDLVVMETCVMHPEEMADVDHASAIMEMIACPVMVVPCTARYQPLEKLVFATDFTDQDDTVLKQIVAFAHQVHAALSLVQVYTKNERANLCSYKAAMLKLQQQYRQQQVTFRLLEEEDVLEGIGDFAEHADADMLLFATQDSFMLKRMFSSNYIKTMAYHTRFPILTFRQIKKKPCSGMCGNCKGKQSAQLVHQYALA